LKLFISHAASDKDLVSALVELLIDGVGMNNSDIFCTSSLSTLKTGTDFKTRVKENLMNCHKVILLATESFFRSPFCLAELGAAWIMDKDICPLIVPPVNFSDLDRTPIAGSQARDISVVDVFAIIRDELNKDGFGKQVSTQQFFTAFNDFKKELNDFMWILKTDKDGFVTVTVTEHQREIHKVQPQFHYHDYCKIDKQLDLGRGYIENESHWLLLSTYSSKNHPEPNDKLRFKPELIKEVINHGKKDIRLFEVSSVQAVGVTVNIS